EALGQGRDLGDGAEVLEEPVALFHRAELQDRPKEMIGQRTPKFWIAHATHPLAGGSDPAQHIRGTSENDQCRRASTASVIAVVPSAGPPPATSAVPHAVRSAWR